MTAPAVTDAHVPGPAQPDIARLKRQVTAAAIAVASILILMKSFAWAYTGSVAMLASLVDSSLDLLASGLNLLAVRHALEPADAEHRFGHGKAEALAGLGQAAFIGGSGAFLVMESLSRMIRPEPLGATGIALAVTIAAIVLTVGLVAFQRYVLSQTRSIAIEADSLHYVGDIASNGAVLVALAAAAIWGVEWLDPVMGLAIAAMILWGAARILLGAYNELMDREVSDAEREQIKEIVRRHPEVLSLHDLRTRRAGHHLFIQLHLDLPPEMTLREAHIISDTVEAELIAAFPGSEVLIHQDPEGVDEVRPAIRD